MAKSWSDKFKSKPHPEVKIIEKDFWGQKAGDRMLIPSPKLIEDYLNDSLPGKQMDIVQMRRDLAAEQHADFTCPMTTSIFLRIVAEYNLEKMARNESEVAPFWRAIDPKSDLAKNSPAALPLSHQKKKKNSTNEIPLT